MTSRAHLSPFRVRRLTSRTGSGVKCGGRWGAYRSWTGRSPPYYAAIDPATPGHVKAVLMAALAYFVMPADMIPDVLAGLGFTDDAAVLMMAVKMLAPHIRSSHVEQARAFLAEQT